LIGCQARNLDCCGCVLPDDLADALRNRAEFVFEQIFAAYQKHTASVEVSQPDGIVRGGGGLPSQR
jgi:hypothetical protein